MRQSVGRYIKADDQPNGTGTTRCIEIYEPMHCIHFRAKVLHELLKIPYMHGLIGINLYDLLQYSRYFLLEINWHVF